MRKQQRGITFVGMVFVGILVAFAALITVRVVPTYLEYQTVLRAAQRASESGTTVSEIRAAFDRAMQVEYVTGISGRDLAISKVNDRVVVEFAYTREIHLFGPAYLVMKYQGRTR